MSVTISGSGQVVVQVQSTVLTTTFSVASASFTSVTGLSVNITPTNASNRILVFVSLFCGTANAQGMMWRITRAGTPIDVSTTALNTNATGGWYPDSGASASNAWCGTSTAFLDSPATTSAITYQIQMCGAAAASTIYLNRRVNDNNFGGTSTITVMEISGT